MKASLGGAGDQYSVELWFWNGLTAHVGPITGTILSRRSADADAKLGGDQLGIGGTAAGPVRLGFSSGKTSAKILAGATAITPRTWHHLVLVRTHDHATLYLDGILKPEISGPAEVDRSGPSAVFAIGGLTGGLAGFEGKIDEVAVYGRALATEEIAQHVRAANDPGSMPHRPGR